MVSACPSEAETAAVTCRTVLTRSPSMARMTSPRRRPASQRYLQCDLLIIDDLGTEMTTQFVCSALYHVVNTRLMESRPTIISTNLTPEQLSVRYSPQIASRLLGTYRLIQFVGQDIRRL